MKSGGNAIQQHSFQVEDEPPPPPPFPLKRRRPASYAVTASPSPARIVCSLLLLSAVNLPSLAHAAIECDDDFACVRKFGAGSVCDTERRICTNPFANGCLRQLRPELFDVRTCNSEDEESHMDPSSTIDTPTCRPSTLNYPEIRIHVQNWDTALLSAWVMQILLSELLNVPATVETSHADGRSASFYDRFSALHYGAMGYDYEALRTANRLGDCRLRKNNEPCAMVIPEVWNGQT